MQMWKILVIVEQTASLLHMFWVLNTIINDKNDAEVPSSGTSQVLLSTVNDDECVKMCLLITVPLFSIYLYYNLSLHKLKSNHLN